MKKLILILTLLIPLLLLISCAEPEIPQGYALLYGIEDYPGQNALNYTVDDAQALGTMLEEKGWNVTLRTDADADLPALVNDIDTLKNQMNSGDRFLFYFSGHGVQLDTEGGEGSSSADNLDEVLALYNSLPVIFDFMSGDQTADVTSVTITDSSLADLLGKLPTKNKTIIIDACNSGGFIGDGFTFSNINPDYSLDSASVSFAPIESTKLYAGWSVTDDDLVQSEYSVLTAAGESEESFELGSIGHGIFTYYLLKTPAKADYNYDGYISLTEAWQFISGSIDTYWNSSFYVDKTEQYMANIAAFPVDPVLFKAD